MEAIRKRVFCSRPIMMTTIAAMLGGHGTDGLERSGTARVYEDPGSAQASTRSADAAETSAQRRTQGLSQHGPVKPARPF
jgi:hypothetical protein